MIHKIKALHDNGKGLSIREISKELSLARNTVRKYLRMTEPMISDYLENPSRSKLLDDHRDFMIFLLKRYPNLSAVKITRKLRVKVDVAVSERSIRRYVQALKSQLATAQTRYYEPVVDHVPGVQCQIDPGELRGLMIGGQERTLHFVVFVLSFSRLMYVGLSFRPLDTQAFIQLHDEAFRYFGGVPEECVYDQTKLVVISEQYRELNLNQRFHEYSTAAGFRIHACEGYDPESKGKVESGVKYVKQDCLYGEDFMDQQAVRLQVQDWVDEVANVRIHGTTGERPRDRFDALEKAHLAPYLTPACVTRSDVADTTRQADKTGLISWKANKYSVPMEWQRARVGVLETQDELLISDLESGEIIARHARCHEKGRIIKNNNHYRDRQQRIIDLEHGIALLAGQDVGVALCRQLKQSEPNIYKDQLVAAHKLLQDFAPLDTTVIAQLAERRGMTATRLKSYLEAIQKAKLREREVSAIPCSVDRLDLSVYASVGHSSGQEVTL